MSWIIPSEITSHPTLTFGGYEIDILVDGDPFGTTIVIYLSTTTSYGLSSLSIPSGDIVIKLRAIGDGTYFDDSDDAEEDYIISHGQLTPPALKVNTDGNQTIEWDAPPEFAANPLLEFGGFEIEIWANGTKFGATITLDADAASLNLLTLVAGSLPKGNIEIRVRAIGDGVYYDDSDNVIRNFIVSSGQLSTPVPKLNSDKTYIEWDDVPELSSPLPLSVIYDIEVYVDGFKVAMLSTTTIIKELYIVGFPVGDIEVRVRALAGGGHFEDSEFGSVEFTIGPDGTPTPKLATPEITLNFSAREIEWDAIDDATKYEIYINDLLVLTLQGADIASKDVLVFKIMDYIDENGDFEIKVIAIGDGTNFTDSDFSDEIYVRISDIGTYDPGVEIIVDPNDPTPDAAFTFAIVPGGVAITGLTDALGKGLNRIVVPDTVTIGITVYNVVEIGERAFMSAKSLQKIILPDTLQTIGKEAFLDASRLTTISVPDSVTSIGFNAFGGCVSLFSIKLPFTGYSANPAYDDIFDDIRKDGHFGWIFGAENREAHESFVPKSIHTIIITGLVSDYAFYRFTSLTNISLESGVETIGKYAFVESAITRMTIPNTVLRIESYAFADTQSLRNITFETGSVLEWIQERAFFNASNLRSIAIPDTVEIIGRGAFAGTMSLQTVTLNVTSNLRIIGREAFMNAKSLTSIYIPASVEQIGEDAFRNTGIKDLTFADNGNLERIDAGAFEGLTGLQAVYIPNSVKTIGQRAFQGTSIKTITFAPDSQLQRLESSAFHGLTGVTSITLPESINLNQNEIHAFCGWTSSQTIIFLGKTQAEVDASKLLSGGWWLGCSVNAVAIGALG